MTNFEKVIKNLDTHRLAFMLAKSGACPFPQENCNNCTQFNENLDADSNCKFPNNMEDIIKCLEMECETDD